MGSIRDWLLKKLEPKPFRGSVPGEELLEAAQELQIRELAFHCCVNLIANAVGKCEFQTYRNGESVQADEYWLWNFEPNRNQNSTAFLHQLIYKLLSENEALVLSQAQQGRETLVVVDDFERPMRYPNRPNEYRGVRVGEVTYSKPFYEQDVLHFRLQHSNTKQVVDRVYDAYQRLMVAAIKQYTWSSGRHMKVHVDQIQQGKEDFLSKYTEILQTNVKPFFDGDNAILPEFDGYHYENLGGNPDIQRSTRDIRAMVDDIFSFTANAFGIPPVLLLGNVAGTKDALLRWLTTGIDPLCDQLQEEIVRKRYGREEWKRGNYLRINTSTMIHFDMFANAANIEKLIGSGAYSINDVRIAAGQSRIEEPWADQHWLTLNIGTMEAAARAAEAKKGGANETKTTVGTAADR